MRTWNRLQALFAHRQLDLDFDEEARAHLDLATADYIERGFAPPEARRLARLRFGAVEASKDAYRDSRGFAWLNGLLCDLRYAVRAIARDRAFALTVTLTLALAIGVNATAFRVMDTMLFAGYPLVSDNEQILYIDERYPTPGCCVSYVDYEVWRSQARAFQDMAFTVPKSVSLSEGSGDARELWVDTISANSLHVLGVRPARGRDFTARDEVPGAAPVVIVSHRYWQARLGGRRDVLGRTLLIDRAPVPIIGVLPEGFKFPGGNDIFLPLQKTAALHLRVANGGMVFGRLAGGASENSARVELQTINQRLAREYPATNRDVYPEIRNYTESIAGPNGRLIYGAVWAGAWFVLLIACANLANLTLARTHGRVRELCTRMALGAGRARVIRQLLLESLPLAAAAGLLAWGAADWSTRAWAAATDSFLDYSPGAGTALYMTGITVAAVVLINLGPIARLWRIDLYGALKAESRGSTISRLARQFSAALVAAQTALAIVLMAGAGVMAHSLWKVLEADIGVKEPEHVFVGRLELPRKKYATPESRRAFFESLRARLSTVPGVESAAVSNGRPADDFEPLPFEVESQTDSLHGTPVFIVSPGYFRTLGATLLSGRDFEASDRPGAPPAIIVNRRFAETWFPGRNAVGRRIRLYAKRQIGAGPWRTIVGVTSNIIQNEWTRQHSVPAAYIPFAQEPTDSAWVFARLPRGSGALVAALRSEVRQMDPQLELLDYATLKASLNFQSPQNMGNYVELTRHAAIAPIYAAIALLLAATGLYAVVSRATKQRTREIGVRMALGANAREIQCMMLGEAMAPVAAGLLLGLAASLGVNRILQSQLVGVSPYDAFTLALAPLILTSVALAGSMPPVRKASRVDPAVTLRHE